MRTDIGLIGIAPRGGLTGETFALLARLAAAEARKAVGFGHHSHADHERRSYLYKLSDRLAREADWRGVDV